MLNKIAQYQTVTRCWGHLLAEGSVHTGAGTYLLSPVGLGETAGLSVCLSGIRPGLPGSSDQDTDGSGWEDPFIQYGFPSGNYPA